MKILIIEDKREDVLEIEDHAKDNGWEIEIQNFQDGIAIIDTFNPDVIVLDRKDEIKPDDARGETIFDMIWKDKFRPTIVFSGMAENFEIDPKYANWAVEPLFSRIKKGDEAPVIEQLDKLEKVAPVLSHMRSELNEALIVSASALSLVGKLPDEIPDDVIKYLFANRIEQYFQTTSVFEQELPSWFQYIVPPISSHLLVGDILEDTADEEDSEKRYAIVLSPSCDIARMEEDSTILIAHSDDFSTIDSDFKTTREKGCTKYNNRKTRIMSILNQGFDRSRLYLPAISNIFPNICFNMKNIETISLNKVEWKAKTPTAGKVWIRKASLSSPFRERVAWAYLSTACRPGVPTLNVSDWTDDMFK